MMSVAARARASLLAAWASRGRVRWPYLLEVGLITAFAFVLRSPFDPGMPGSGLDPSWMQALLEARSRGVEIGRELVYSIGPLSSLYTNEYHPRFFESTVCLSLLLCALYAYLLQRLTRIAFKASWARALIMLATTLVVSQYDCFLYVFAPLGVALLFSSEPLSARAEAAWWSALAALCLAKVSFGGIAALVFVCVLVTRLRDRTKLSRLLVFPAACVVIWLLIGQRLLVLPYYAFNTVYVSTGYVAAMNFTPPEWSVTVYWLAVAAVAIALGVALRKSGRWPWHMPVPGILFISWLIFKGGYIRLNLNSTAYAFCGVAIVAWLFCAGVAQSRRQRLAYTSVLLPVLLAVAFLCQVGDGKSLPALAREQLSAVPSIVSANFKALSANDYRERYEAGRGRVRQRHPITPASGSFDIFPHDASVIFSHDLSWRPRPNYQSYAAYTPELLAQNLAFYRSDRAPENVLFELRTIDQRYPMHDDCPTLIELLSRYELLAMRKPLAQLRRRDQPIAYRFEAERKLKASFGEPIDVRVEPGTRLWARIDVKKSALGSLYAMFYRVPIVHMDLTLQNNARRSFRIIPTIASSGILLSPFVRTTGEFLALSRDGDLPGTPVKSIRLRAEEGFEHMFRDQVEITLSTLVFEKADSAEPVAEQPPPRRRRRRVRRPPPPPP